MIVRADNLIHDAKVFLDKPCKMGGHSWDEIVWKVENKHAQLWLVWNGEVEAALLTQVTTDDVCEILLAGGLNARNWIVVAERVISDWAFGTGLKKLRIWGRRGWKKLLPHWDAKEEDGLVILELSHEV